MRTKSWTVMVYLAGDNNLDDAGVADLTEMKTVGTTDQINIVAQFDRQAAGAQTRRYLIMKGGALEKDAVESLGETNTGDPAVLIDFAQWAIKNYPAQRYLLVIWNHGNGWDDEDIYHAARHDLGLNVVRRGESTGDGTDGKSVSIRRVRVVGGPKFHRALFRPTITRALKTRAIAYDDNAEDFLDNVELQKVLAAIHKKFGRKLDLLGMDACLMSMAEIGYQLRDHVGLTVGSEETEPGDGWPYNSILRDLARKPQMSARDLSSLIVRRYVESYDSKSNVTQAACDLAKCDALGQAIDGLAASLKAEMADASVRTAILTARSQVQSYEKPEYVDLYDLCALITSNCQSKKVQAACAKLKQALTKGGYVVASGSKGQGVANSHGVSIYFPDRAASISAPISPLYANLDFAKKLKWADFLTAWLQSLKRGARR
jgi:hypothetical protein